MFGEVGVSVCRLGVCVCVSGFACFLVVFSSRGLEILISNCVYYFILSGFGFVFFFPSSKIVNTFAFQGQGVSPRD